MPANDSTLNLITFVKFDAFIYSVRKIAVPTPRGFAKIYDIKIKSTIPTIARNIHHVCSYLQERLIRTET